MPFKINFKKLKEEDLCIQHTLTKNDINLLRRGYKLCVKLWKTERGLVSVDLKLGKVNFNKEIVKKPVKLTFRTPNNKKISFIASKAVMKKIQNKLCPKCRRRSLRKTNSSIVDIITKKPKKVYHCFYCDYRELSRK